LSFEDEASRLAGLVSRFRIAGDAPAARAPVAIDWVPARSAR
jgi:hypothetical protein